MIVCALTAAWVVALCASSGAAQPMIRTFVGGGPPNGTPAAALSFPAPQSVAVDAGGAMLVLSRGRVYRVDSGGAVTIVAGNDGRGFGGDGGPAPLATLNVPSAIAIDPAGDLYILDNGNFRVRKVSGGIITTVAGNGTTAYSDGPALSTGFGTLFGLAIDTGGAVFFSDVTHNRVVRLAGGVVSTVAGTGVSGFTGDGGLATSARLASPRGVAVDASGTLYISDTGNRRVRRVSGGIITTFAGNGLLGSSGDGGPATSASLSPTGLTVNGGDLLIIDQRRLRQVSGGVITTIAGTGSLLYSGDGGPATAAGIDLVSVAIDASGQLILADNQNGRVRQVSGGIITTRVGNGTPGYIADGGAPTAEMLAGQGGIALDATGAMYFVDQQRHRIRRVADGVITTIAGTGVPGFSGDGGPAIDAQFNTPTDIAIDSAGDLYICDASNARIRKISGGIITTVAGNGTFGFGGDGGPPTSAAIQPEGIAIDASGTLYINDQFNFRIRAVQGGVITTVAGNGVDGLSPDGVPAVGSSIEAFAIAVDGGGAVYFAEPNNRRIRKIVGGILTTAAGTGVAGYAGDGGPATSAQLWSPIRLAFDASDALWISDGDKVRKIQSGIISAVAGTGVTGFSGDGGPAISAQLNFALNLAADPYGDVFVVDSENHRIREITSRVQPDIVWTQPSDIVRGTPLGSGQLNAAATFNGNSVGGTFVYTPPAGTLLNAGAEQTLMVTFTPDDLRTYEKVSATTTINVLKATPTLAWSAPLDIIQGTPLSGTQLNATAAFGGNPVAGTFTYTPAAGTVLPAGANQTLHVDFGPSDALNYSAASADVSINVRANHAPVANPQSLNVVTGNPLAVTLTGSDVDGDPITFAVVAGPTNGTLSGAPPNVTYTPNAGYTGPDGFTFTVNDGLLTSAAATIAITVQLPAKPTVTLKINGQHPPSGVVTTNGPMTLTLDISPSSYTSPVSWFWALIVNNQVLWVTATGITTTPAPLVVAPPTAFTGAQLLNITVPPGTTITTLFALVDGSGAIGIDVVTVTRPPG